MAKTRSKTPIKEESQVTKKIKKQPKAKKEPLAKKEASATKEAPAKQSKSKRVAAQPKKAAKKSNYGVLTEAQYQDYIEKKKDLDAHVLNALKEMCRKNDQKIGGTKPELIERIAQGQILGKIPRCPNCAGGKPQFDFKTGYYKCPGYQDDDKFRWCQKKFNFDEITRDSWIN